MLHCPWRRCAAPACCEGSSRADFRHELLHSRAPVVARHPVVEIHPRPLETLVVGAVRCQKVQPDPASCRRLQDQLGLRAVMDAVIVENQMNQSSAARP